MEIAIEGKTESVFGQIFGHSSVMQIFSALLVYQIIFAFTGFPIFIVSGESNFWLFLILAPSVAFGLVFFYIVFLTVLFNQRIKNKVKYFDYSKLIEYFGKSRKDIRNINLEEELESSSISFELYGQKFKLHRVIEYMEYEGEDVSYNSFALESDGEKDNIKRSQAKELISILNDTNVNRNKVAKKQKQDKLLDKLQEGKHKELMNYKFMIIQDKLKLDSSILNSVETEDLLE